MTWSKIHLAAYFGYDPVIEEALLSGPEAFQKELDDCHIDCNKYRPLDYQVDYQIDYYQYTPLMIAIRRNQSKIVSLLLKYKDSIDIGLSEKGGGRCFYSNNWITEKITVCIDDTVLDIAAQFADKVILEQILDAKKWDRNQLNRASNYLFKRGDRDILKLFLAKLPEKAVPNLSSLKSAIGVNNEFYLYCKYGRILGEYKNKLTTKNNLEQPTLKAVKKAIELFQKNESHEKIVSALMSKINDSEPNVISGDRGILLKRLDVLNDKINSGLSDQNTSFSFVLNVLNNIQTSLLYVAICLYFNNLTSKISDGLSSMRNSSLFFKPKSENTKSGGIIPENDVIGLLI